MSCSILSFLHKSVKLKGEIQTEKNSIKMAETGWSNFGVPRV